MNAATTNRSTTLGCASKELTTNASEPHISSASDQSNNRRRSMASATAPPQRAVTARGTSCTVPTIPTAHEDLVSSKISHGERDVGQKAAERAHQLADENEPKITVPTQRREIEKHAKPRPVIARPASGGATPMARSRAARPLSRRLAKSSPSAGIGGDVHHDPTAIEFALVQSANGGGPVLPVGHGDEPEVAGRPGVAIGDHRGLDDLPYGGEMRAQASARRIVAQTANEELDRNGWCTPWCLRIALE